MKLGSRHKADPSFNMSSMTDIVFLLLVFFMLTSNVATTGLTIDRPKSGQNKVESVKEIVTVDKDGQIYFSKDNIKMSPEELKNALEKVFSSLDNNVVKNTIVISGDKGADYGTVIEVYNVASEIKNARAVLALDQP